MSNVIECPHCHELVNVEEALTHKLEEEYNNKFKKLTQENEVKLQSELQKQLELKEKELQEKAALAFEEKLKTVKAEKAELETKLNEAKNKATEEAWSVFQQEKKALLGLIESEKSLRESAIQKASQERKQLEELLKKAQVENENRYLSQREQGESFEQSAAKTIKVLFPHDQIEEVKVGANGTDLILHVSDQGRIAGSISIECKNPSKKNSWATWVKKIRKDMSVEGSKLALIVSTIPFDQGVVTDNGQVFGVHSSEAIGVLTLLRKAIIEISRAEAKAENSNEKAQMLMDFFGSSKWDNMLLDATRSLTEISLKVNTIKNAADHIHKNGELIHDNFVSQLKNQIELAVLNNGMKAA
jgi:hypothetical protein